MQNGDEIRAALESLLSDPPPELVRLVRQRCGEQPPSRKDVRRRLAQLQVCDPAAERAQRPEVLEAYRELERYCLNLAPDAVDTRLWQPAVSVSFLKGSRRFCDVAIYSHGMRLSLRDRHERAVHSITEAEAAKPLIRAAFEAT